MVTKYQENSYQSNSNASILTTTNQTSKPNLHNFIINLPEKFNHRWVKQVRQVVFICLYLIPPWVHHSFPWHTLESCGPRSYNYQCSSFIILTNIAGMSQFISTDDILHLSWQNTGYVKASACMLSVTFFNDFFYCFFNLFSLKKQQHLSLFSACCQWWNLCCVKATQQDGSKPIPRGTLQMQRLTCNNTRLPLQGLRGLQQHFLPWHLKDNADMVTVWTDTTEQGRAKSVGSGGFPVEGTTDAHYLPL